MCARASPATPNAPASPATPTGPAGPLSGFLLDVRPLSNAAFRRLWIGQGVSLVGFQLTSVAVPVQVYELTGSSFWVGALGVVSLVPLIVFGLWGGAVADNMDRRLLIVIYSVVGWSSTLGLLAQALLGLGQLWLIMVCVGVQSTGFAVTSPTRGAIIPRLLPVELVQPANTLSFTLNQLSVLLGPLLAGAILVRWSYAVAYGVDALLFTAGLYAALRLPALPPLGDTQGRPGLRSVIQGLGYLAGRPVLLMSFVVDIIAMGVGMPRALFPELAATRFGGGSAVGWLYASVGIGGLAGGLISGWMGRVRRQGVALVAAIVAWGLAVAAAGLV